MVQIDRRLRLREGRDLARHDIPSHYEGHGLPYLPRAPKKAVRVSCDDEFVPMWAKGFLSWKMNGFRVSRLHPDNCFFQAWDDACCPDGKLHRHPVRRVQPLMYLRSIALFYLRHLPSPCILCSVSFAISVSALPQKKNPIVTSPLRWPLFTLLCKSEVS